MKKISYEVKLSYLHFCLLITDTVTCTSLLYYFINYCTLGQAHEFLLLCVKQNEYKEYEGTSQTVSYNFKGKAECFCRVMVKKNDGSWSVDWQQVNIGNKTVLLESIESFRLAGTTGGHLVQPPVQAGSARAGCSGPYADGF